MKLAGWLVASVLSIALAGALAACAEPAPQSPTASPASAPTIKLGDWSSSDGRWTFNATVNPRGSPTDVVLEYGFGPGSAPIFDVTVPVEAGLFDAAAVTVTVDIGEEALFCARFTAANEVGSTSSEPRCNDWLRSMVIAGPSGTSASNAP